MDGLMANILCFFVCFLATMTSYACNKIPREPFNYPFIVAHTVTCKSDRKEIPLNIPLN